MSITLHRGNKPIFHDKLVPRTGVCNLCRAVLGIDVKFIDKHHWFGRHIDPHTVIEVCRLCHFVLHAMTGTAGNNSPSTQPDWQYRRWLRKRNLVLGEKWYWCDPEDSTSQLPIRIYTK